MTIAERVHNINQMISHAESSYQRESGSVRLLGASKGQNADAIKQAFMAGLQDFGENYLQEAQVKMDNLTDLPICWHFIGPIQSNKTKGIASCFAWVHSVDKLKIAQQLNNFRPDNLPPLNVCIQVNLDQEKTKSGINAEYVSELASHIVQLPSLQLRGLMAIPIQQTNEENQYQSFLRLTHLLKTLNNHLNLKMDTLSMGMSNDINAAIRAGSTIVRIGRALFGERK